MSRKHSSGEAGRSTRPFGRLALLASLALSFLAEDAPTQTGTFCVDWDVAPFEIIRGATRTVPVSLTNCGTETISPSRPDQLNYRGWRDATNTSTVDSFNPSTIFPRDVPPNDTIETHAVVRAPYCGAVPCPAGIYRIRWDIFRGFFTGYFFSERWGTETGDVTVTVIDPVPGVLPTPPPTPLPGTPSYCVDWLDTGTFEIMRGTTRTVKIRFRNCGTQTLSPLSGDSANYHEWRDAAGTSVVDGAELGTFLSRPVLPNETLEMEAAVRAPNCGAGPCPAGEYRIRWDVFRGLMTGNYLSQWGAATREVTVEVLELGDPGGLPVPTPEPTPTPVPTPGPGGSGSTWGGALWAAEEEALYKLSTEDARGIFRIEAQDRGRAVALDEVRGVVWVYGADHHLRSWTFDGAAGVDDSAAVVDVEVPGLPATVCGEPDPEVRPFALSVDQRDGSVWLGVCQGVFHFDEQGGAIAADTKELASPVHGVVMDSLRAKLWVATAGNITGYDDLGNAVTTISVTPPEIVRTIDVAPPDGDVWAGLATGVRRYTTAGASEGAGFALPGLIRIASDGGTGLWAATRGRVVHLDGSFQALADLEPFALPNLVWNLAGDPRDGSARVSSQNRIVHVDPEGTVLPEAARFGDTALLQALSAYVDRYAPVIDLLQPPEDALLNTDRPALVVEASDIGSGVDLASVEMSHGGGAFAVTCQGDETGLSCVPDDPLPQGAITVSATIADQEGNRSGAATRSFEIDSVAPTAVSSSAITVSQPVDGSVAVTGAAGAAEPGATVRVKNLRTGEIVEATVNPDGSFSVVIAAELGDDLEIVVVDEAANASVPTIATVGASLRGRLLDANDYAAGTVTPVVNGVVSLLNTNKSASSDSDGNFTLFGVPSGSQRLNIDASQADAAPDGSPYAGFREPITLLEGQENVLDGPIFLPRVETASLTTVDPNATTVVQNTRLGVTLTIPAHTAKGEDGNDFTGQLSISEVPRGFAPVPLPEDRPGTPDHDPAGRGDVCDPRRDHVPEHGRPRHRQRGGHLVA